MQSGFQLVSTCSKYASGHCINNFVSLQILKAAAEFICRKEKKMIEDKQLELQRQTDRCQIQRRARPTRCI